MSSSAEPGRPSSRQTKPALRPDELIKTGKNGRIRLIEKRPPRRKPRPSVKSKE